jgi:hypothetical protein
MDKILYLFKIYVLDFFSLEFKNAKLCFAGEILHIINFALENSFVPFWIQLKWCFLLLIIE